MGADHSAALPAGTASGDTSSKKSSAPGTPGKKNGSGGALKVTTTSMSPQMLSLYQRVAINSKHRMSPSYASSAGSTGRLRRSMSTGSAQTENEWGYFEDVGEPPTPTYSDVRSGSRDEGEYTVGEGGGGFGGSSSRSGRGGGGGDEPEMRSLTRALSLPQPATTPPMYVLESTLATQQLWYMTAGRRPKQPTREREYFEELWKKNFEQSAVQYPETAAAAAAAAAAASVAVAVAVPAVQPSAPCSSQGANTNGGATAPGPADADADAAAAAAAAASSSSRSAKTPLPVREEVPYKEYDGDILYRGKGPFSNSVSKSFPDKDVQAMTLQVGPYLGPIKAPMYALY